MKEFNRREFIKTTLLSSGAFFFSFSQLENLTASTAVSTQTSYDLKDLQQKGKEHFYKKEYKEAEACYKRITEINPALIIGYDGLARICRAQNNQLAASEIYRKGWLIQQDVPIFCDRLAISIRRITTGNKKQEIEFCEKYGNSLLLDSAAQIYIDLWDKKGDSVHEYIKFGLLDIKQHALSYNNKYKDKKALTSPVQLSIAIDARIEQIDGMCKQRWEHLRKKKNKKDFVVNALSILKTKDIKGSIIKRRELYSEKEKVHRVKEMQKHEKQLAYTLFHLSIKDKNTAQAEHFYKEIKKADGDDTNSRGVLVRLYRNQKSYSNLVTFQKDHYLQKKDFWNTCSYAQALRLQGKKENKQENYRQAQSLYQDLLSSTKLTSSQSVCVYGGLFDCLLGLKMNNELRSTIIKVLAPFPLSVFPFVLTYIKSWIQDGNPNKAEHALIQIMQGTESELIKNDPIFAHLKIFNKQIKQYDLQLPTKVSKEILLDIQYLFYAIYKKKNDLQKMGEVINRIKSLDAKSSFLNKI